MLLLALGLVTFKTEAQKYFRIDPARENQILSDLDQVRGPQKVDMLNELGLMYAWEKPEVCDSLLAESIQLSERSGYLNGLARAHFNQGFRHFLFGASSLASREYFEALDIAEKIQDTMLLGRIYNNLAMNLFFSSVDYDKMASYAEKALYYFKLADARDELANLYIQFAGTEANVADNTGKGRIFIDMFLDVVDDVNLSNFEKGVGYAVAGDIYFQEGNAPKGFEYYRRAIALYDTRYVEERALKAQHTAALGEYHGRLGRIDSAHYYSDLAIEMAREITYIFGLSHYHYRKGLCYESEGLPELAIRHFDSTVYYGQKMAESGSIYEKPEYRNMVGWSYEMFKPSSPAYRKNRGRWRMASGYSSLSGIYTQLGMGKEALEAYRLAVSYVDTAERFTRQLDLAEVQASYETEQKDQVIDLLSRENELNQLKARQTRNLLIGLAGLAVLIIMAAILLIRQMRIRTNQRNMMLEQRLLRSQMNPHFIFNALSNISNLIEKKDNATASRYLTCFSRLVRHILESTRNESIDLDDEISNIENYLALQKLRFGDKFDYHLKIDANIDPEEMAIPPMLIQPFIENAIEHGIQPKDQKGHIDIRMKRKNGMLMCEVDDDGIGRKRAMELKGQEEQALEHSITRERLHSLNRKLKNKVSLEIEDLTTDMGVSLGTRVRIGIPILD